MTGDRAFADLPDDVRALFATPEMPALDARRRPGALPLDLLTQKIAALAAPLPTRWRPQITCLALLWHDHLDDAHSICQAGDSPEDAYLHGLVHRREPDYGNARYWFRQTGGHPVFPILGARVETLAPAALDLPVLLLPGPEWNPTAFVDACARAARLPSSDPLVRGLAQIQGLEFAAWLEYFFRP